MAGRRFKIVGSLVLAAAAASAALTSNVAVADEPSEGNWVQVTEFATNSGYTFYTVDPAEVERAKGFGWTEKQDAQCAGVKLADEELEGTVPLTRWRHKTLPDAYIVSMHPVEEQQLPANYEKEGVLGYIYEEPREGTMELARYAKGADYRISTGARADLIAAGYRKEVDPFTGEDQMGFIPEQAPCLPVAGLPGVPALPGLGG
jgi:hypothetical protein